MDHRSGFEENVMVSHKKIYRYTDTVFWVSIRREKHILRLYSVYLVILYSRKSGSR